MERQLTREQNIRKARQIQSLEKLIAVFYRTTRGLRAKSPRKEMLLSTEAGMVRTLWYGSEIAGSAPVFFDLHGGGFVLGSAEMDEAMNVELSRQLACRVVSIDYAKAPGFPFPAALDQVHAVVKHVHDNAEAHSIDRKRMAIGGHSAGGNLAAAACLKARREGRFRFVCQVLDYPPLDLSTSPLDKPRPKGSIPPGMAMMFDACYVDPARARDPLVSPVYAAGEELAGLPPALFILPGRDSLHDEGLRYAGMLDAAGVETECHEYPDSVHGFTYKPSPDTTDACAKMTAFLKKHLERGCS
jgi:acetyl esterase